MNSEIQFKSIFVILIIAILSIIVFYEVIGIIYKNSVKNFYDDYSYYIINNIENIKSGDLKLYFVKSICIKDTKSNLLIDTIYKENTRLTDFRNTFIYETKDNKIIFITYKNKNRPFEIYLTIVTVLLIAILIGILLYHISIYLRRRQIITKLQKVNNYDDLIDIKKDIEEDSDIYNILELFENIMNAYNNKIRTLIERNNELIIANNRLKNRDIMKTGIIENVSHEFLTPLTKIKGYLDYIYREKLGELNASQKEGLFIAKRNVDLLMKHINNILEHFKQESLDISTELVSIKKVLMDIYEHNRIDAKNKNIIFEINVNELKNPIRANKDSIMELFENLINNALKFTSKNGIIQIIGFERIVDNKPYAIVKIKDTGIGIAKDETNKIFDKFYQVDNKESRKYPGMGLGLTIVKNILSEYNGDIKVHSIYGKGSEFIVRFPLTVEEGN